MTRPTASAQALGRVLQWDAAKGLGFVQAQHDGARLLMRRSDLRGRLCTREPEAGEPVQFRRSSDGRRALDVLTLAPPAPKAADASAGAPSSPRTTPTSSNHLLVIPAFALLLAAMHWQHPLPRALPGLYGALSMALFLVYGMDKWAARRGRARVAETSLHLVALLGGWPGALLGQQVFRHKTAKPQFLRLTWGMVALNLSLLVAGWTWIR